MPSNFKVLTGASGESADPNFKNVTLLLHGDGSNGAQNNTFLDSSTNNFTITRNGNATQGSFSPYGSNWSNFFDGTGDYLEVADNAAFDFGTGDFTIEMWMFAQNLASIPMLFHKGSSGSNGWFCQTSTTTLYFGQLDSARYTTWSVSLSNNTWYHIALTRVGSSLNVFINGVSQTAKTVSGADTSNDNASPVYIGQIAGGAYFFQGYLSNYRIVKGTAVYTSNFTPSTTPLTAITNTSLLTCQSNRFRDASTNNFTITRNGDVTVTNFAPFAPSAAYSTSTNGGSAYFDGTGDYLTTPNNAAFAFGTGDYTIECWINTNVDTGNIIDLRVGGNLTAYPAIYLSSGSVFFWTGTGSDGVNVGSYTKNAWVHLAVSRSGSSLKFFINGVQTYSATNSTNLSQGTVTIAARWDAGFAFAGYISNARIVKGTAVYTSAFTPPTAPVTAITNTSLLLNATNGAIFDNSMKNDLETAGNAQISTSVKKFGTGSMAFDGSGDYLTMPSTSELAFGAGNFTIEMWVYRVGSGTDQVICDFRSGTGTTIKPCIFINSSNQLIYLVNGSAVITGGTISSSTWTHVALSKSGSSTKMFINGTQTGSTYTDTNDYGATSRCMIAADDDGGQNAFLNGYIDDLRITKGVARYTANFTPPTAAFPNK
jgi:hypothetical protein